MVILKDIIENNLVHLGAKDCEVNFLSQDNICIIQDFHNNVYFGHTNIADDLKARLDAWGESCILPYEQDSRRGIILTGEEDFGCFFRVFCNPNDAFNLTYFLTMSLVDSIKEMGVNCEIVDNDIIVNEHKVCGTYVSYSNGGFCWACSLSFKDHLQDINLIGLEYNNYKTPGYLSISKEDLVDKFLDKIRRN